jgi:transposase
MVKRGGRRRDPARERFWRQTIRRQQRSGLTVRDFCRREGLKDRTFRWWRQELARRDRQTSNAPEPKPTLESAAAVATLLFVPVRVLDQGAVPSPLSPAIDIVLPAGPTVRVPVGFDRGLLHEVLAVLEQRRC